MLLSSSFVFFYTVADLLHFVHSDIYLFSQASFLLHIISKFGNSFYVAEFSRNHSSPRKAFFRARYSFILCFRRYCKWNSNLKKETLISICPKGAQYVIPRCSSVRPSISNSLKRLKGFEESRHTC